MRNALAISGMAIVLGTSGMVLDASANTFNENNFRHERNLKNKVVPKTNVTQRHRRGLAGTVASMTTDSLTITKNAKTFTVTKTGTTRIFNKAWQTVDFANIKVGDQLIVHGTLTDTTLTARTIRDLSL